jgi:hypothetical protein
MKSLSLVVDALVGNTTMDVLDFHGNGGLSLSVINDNSKRLVERTRLKKICATYMDYQFDCDCADSMREFISVLRGKKTSLKEYETGIVGQDETVFEPFFFGPLTTI